jgi:3D (Asp-Asp-Asp) domain-containing protein
MGKGVLIIFISLIAPLALGSKGLTYTTYTLTGTAYNATVRQCNDDPTVTACGTRPEEGTIAVSRDLFEMGWKCGFLVNHKGEWLTVNDKMGKYATIKGVKTKTVMTFDVFYDETSDAWEYGRQKRQKIKVLEVAWKQ